MKLKLTMKYDEIGNETEIDDEIDNEIDEIDNEIEIDNDYYEDIEDYDSGYNSDV